MRRSKITFSILHGENGLDSALTEYAGEWLVVMASELPKKERSIRALAQVAQVEHRRLTHWLAELKVKDRIFQLWDELDEKAVSKEKVQNRWTESNRY